MHDEGDGNQSQAEITWLCIVIHQVTLVHVSKLNPKSYHWFTSFSTGYMPSSALCIVFFHNINIKCTSAISVIMVIENIENSNVSL